MRIIHDSSIARIIGYVIKFRSLTRSQPAFPKIVVIYNVTSTRPIHHCPRTSTRLSCKTLFRIFLRDPLTSLTTARIRPWAIPSGRAAPGSACAAVLRTELCESLSRQKRPSISVSVSMLSLKRPVVDGRRALLVAITGELSPERSKLRRVKCSEKYA